MRTDTNQKVQSGHLTRNAYLYVRQPTLHQLVENTETRMLEVKASGKLSANDYETLEPGVEKLIESSGKIKVLFIMHDFHGWEMGAVWEDIKFATKHCHDIDQIAMIGEKDWERWMATICKPFTMAKIKYFEAHDMESAWDWLGEAS